MATLKPIGTNKKKEPLYLEDIVQIYGPVPRNGKSPFNPGDAQKVLKKLVESKKAIKAKFIAGASGMTLKKKGLGKKPPLEQMPYTSVKGFYQFKDNPGCLVVAVEDKQVKPQYVIFAPTNVEKTITFVKILQAAQWAEKSNLKNKPKPLPEVDNKAAIAGSRRSSGVLSPKSITDGKSAATKDSRSSSTSSRSSERTVETPDEVRRESVKRRSVSSPSFSRKSRSPSIERIEQRERSPSPAASRSPSISSRRKSTTSFSGPSPSTVQSRRSKSKTASRISSRSSSFSSSSRSPKRVSSRASLTREPTPVEVYTPEPVKPEPKREPTPEPKREPKREPTPEPKREPKRESEPEKHKSKPSHPTSAQEDAECHFVAFDNKPKASKKYRSSSSSSSSSESEAYEQSNLPKGGVYYLAPHRHKNITKGALAKESSYKPRHSERSRIFIYVTDSSDSSSDSETELTRFKYPRPITSPEPRQHQPPRLRTVSTSSSSSSSSSDSDEEAPHAFIYGRRSQRT